MNAVVIIPARYASTRLAGKVLLKETGKFLMQHTWERALEAGLIDEVIIATDDERVAAAAQGFGATAVMTSREHLSGTDRLAEVAAGLDAQIIINVQADEPEIEPAMIDQLVEMLRQTDAPMATLAAPVGSEEELADPNVVKVVLDKSGYALYFSRAVIPYVRDREVSAAGCEPSSVSGERTEATLSGEQSNVSSGRSQFLRHIGIYGYKREFLLKYPGLARGRLEELEKLEQLRALENGYRIKVGLAHSVPVGVDTPEQYEAFKRRCERK
jgi:3-deoxy-manno-octulosonate cytidylyltransferase (CMP-KDO synthetase)